ncbi:multidrug effflux MFS transporter [Hoeflea marina]|nr:multidrug effflux MFS transporter [Hoeflea marina]
MQKKAFLDRRSPPHIVTLVVIAGLAALSMNMFLPSLPGIAVHFGADYSVVTLSVSGYLAFTAVLQLFIGPMSDRYGRRPVLLWSLVLYLVATAATMIAPSVETFLLARMVQAAVVSGLVLSRAIVRDMVDTDRAASMIGYVTMGMSVVPMVGPALGGLLEDLFGWKASFVVLLLAGVATLALAWLDLGETNRHRSTDMLRQFKAYPDLARSRRFWGYTLTATFASGAFFSFLGGGPYVATEFLGMRPSTLGLYFFFIATGYMIGSFISGRHASRVGINRMMIAGNIIAAAGMLMSLLLLLAGFWGPLTFFGPVFFVGLGNGVTLPSANAGIVGVRPHLAGSASGLGGAIIIGGGAGLSVVTGWLLTPQSGPAPLIALMLASSLAGVIASAYVVRVQASLRPGVAAPDTAD